MAVRQTWGWNYRFDLGWRKLAGLEVLDSEMSYGFGIYMLVVEHLRWQLVDS